ncbi:MAG: PEGA domain-containing protein [Nitrospinota bacterium]
MESRPSSLKVAVDGVKRGDSPVTVEAISPGRHTVKIGDGSGDYPSQSYEVNVRPGETYRLSAAMVLIRPRRFRSGRTGGERSGSRAESGLPGHPVFPCGAAPERDRPRRRAPPLHAP